MIKSLKQWSVGLEPTYKELKPEFDFSRHSLGIGLEPTYKELKPRRKWN
ncbi:MAG: hypothetical protein CH6_1043 [Candidatus Kapaibacterium sp.]|nr:MAG: hypothetical protein CH6_1043 [Candidatus Kapabacteria bacterium]